MSAHRITAQEFEDNVKRDPAWASKLTEPVEVAEFCDMEHSNITHLSPLLQFTGRNEFGDAASFRSCRNLKVAQGEFFGFVYFCDSGIEIIGNLIIKNTDDEGYAASFRNCKNLKIAEGNFPGHVDFSYSAVNKIRDLIIHEPNYGKKASTFDGCKQLKVLEGIFTGSVNCIDSGIEEIGKINFSGPNYYVEYIRAEGSPVAKNESELRKLFMGKSLKELNSALIATNDKHVALALKSLIAKGVLKSSQQDTLDIEI